MKTLRLINLHYNKTDDNNTKLNNIFLTVDNGRFHIFRPESMMDGSDWRVNADIQFNKQDIISFFDEDLVRILSIIKYFRNHIVEENEIHDVPKKVSFATNNANYILTYEII